MTFGKVQRGAVLGVYLLKEVLSATLAILVVEILKLFGIYKSEDVRMSNSRKEGLINLCYNSGYFNHFFAQTRE